MYFKVNKNNLNTLFITAAAELGGGNIASSTVIHELGHGMGLAHAPDNGNGSLQALSGAVVDDLRYTIMTAFVSEASSF